MGAGFVYILINASMPGVVKVGKTERDPEGRAKELSGVTGVPTPFVVVYQEFFDECSVAEAYVHTFLEAKGYRVAANREFFSAPAQAAIQALIQAKAALCGKGDGEQAATANAPSDSSAIPQTIRLDRTSTVLFSMRTQISPTSSIAERLAFGKRGQCCVLAQARH